MSNLLKKVVAGLSTAAMVASSLLIPASTVAAATAGGVYSTPDGTVWFVTSDMQKRPFTSAGAFLSYGFLSFSQVQPADASVTALPTGSFIAPQDGRIFCATATKGSDVAGECSLIVGGQKAAFTSAAVFAAQGFSFSRAFYGDSSFLTKTSNIDNGSAQHRPGTMINNNGTVQLVVSGGLWGVPSLDVFNSWGWSFADVVPANAADVVLSQIGIIPGRVAGQLVPTGVTGGPTPTPTSNGNLGDDEGDIVSVTEVSTEDATAPEGETSEVFGFEAEIEGDVQIDRVDFYMELVTNAGATISADPDDYFQGAMLLVDGEEVADLDVDEFNDDTAWGVVTDGATADDEFRLRFSGLGLNYSDGDMPEFVLAFDTNDVIDSADQAADWRVDLETDSIRFVDGRGFSDTAGAALSEDFGIDAEEAAELTVQTSENDPEGTVVEVSDSDTTDGVEIFVFEIEEENDVDVTINDLTVTVTALDASAAAADESAVLDDAHLYHGTTLLDSVSVAAGGVLAFEDIDLDIAGGDSEELRLEVDIADVDLFGEGYTLSATISGATDIDDAEDENGNDEGDMTLGGTATSDTHELRSEGIMVEFVDADADRTVIADAAGEFDQGTFTITFEVTAFNADARVDMSCEEGGADAAGQGVEYTITNSASNSTACNLASSTTDSEDTANTFEVDEGTTREFTLTVNATASADHFAEVALESINWGTATNDTNANYYTFNLDDFKTNAIFLNAF